jgi:hypothetical protein
MVQNSKVANENISLTFLPPGHPMLHWIDKPMSLVSRDSFWRYFMHLNFHISYCLLFFAQMKYAAQKQEYSTDIVFCPVFFT